MLHEEGKITRVRPSLSSFGGQCDGRRPLGELLTAFNGVCTFLDSGAEACEPVVSEAPPPLARWPAERHCSDGWAVGLTCSLEGRPRHRGGPRPGCP